MKKIIAGLMSALFAVVNVASDIVPWVKPAEMVIYADSVEIIEPYEEVPDAGQQCDVEESAYLSQAMEVREHLKNHDEQFSVEIAFENEPENPGELVYAVYNKSVEHTGNPDEGDYLKLGIYQLGMSFEIVSGVQGIKQIISYEVKYNSSKSQDDEAKEKADKIIEYLDLDEK